MSLDTSLTLLDASLTLFSTAQMASNETLAASIEEDGLDASSLALLLGALGIPDYPNGEGLQEMLAAMLRYDHTAWQRILAQVPSGILGESRFQKTQAMAEQLAALKPRDNKKNKSSSSTTFAFASGAMQVGDAPQKSETLQAGKDGSREREWLQKFAWTNADRESLFEKIRLKPHGASLEESLLDAALQVALEAGFEREQIFNLFLILVEKKEEVFIKEAYKCLPTAIQSLNKTDWTSAQKYQLLTSLVEKSGRYVWQAYKLLPRAIKGLNETDWTVDQKSQLLLLIAEKAEVTVWQAYDSLFFAIEYLNKTDWTSREKYQRLTMVVEKGGREVWMSYGYLSLANKTHWPLERILQIHSLLAEKPMDTVWSAYQCLFNATKGLKMTDWNVEQQYQFLLLLAERAGENTERAYKFFPRAIEGLNETDWTSAEKYQFLLLLAEKAGETVWQAYEFLPDAIHNWGLFPWNSARREQLMESLLRTMDRDKN